VTETNAGDRGIYNNNQSGGTVNLTNCTSTNAGGHGINNNNQSGGAVNITNGTITNAGSSGGYNTSQSGGTCALTNCVVTSAGTYGILDSSQSDGVFEAIGCVVDSSGDMSIYISDCDGGTQTVSRCVAKDGSGTHGVDVNGSASGNVLIKNTLSLRHVAESYSCGLIVFSSNDVLFYNNTTYGNECGLRDESGTNTVAKNNLHKDDNDGVRVQNGPHASFTSDYNHVDHTSGNFGRRDGTDCAALSNWQSTSSQGANSQEGDPLFFDEPNDKYRLTLSSPCIGAGDNSLGVTDDIDSFTRLDPPCIGAYEAERGEFVYLLDEQSAGRIYRRAYKDKKRDVNG
jgi:hypothetical protein